MYVWQMALVSWAVLVAAQQVLQKDKTWHYGAATVLLSLLIGYSHGTGFVWVAAVTGLQLALQVGRWNGRVVTSTACSLLASTVGMIPWLHRASLRAPGHLAEAEEANWGEVLAAVFGVPTGSAWQVWLCGGAILLVGLGAFARGSQRRTPAALLLAVASVFALVFFVGLFRPMFHLRAFLLLVPVGALCLGILMAAFLNVPWPRRWPAQTIAGVVVLLMAYANARMVYVTPKPSIMARAVSRAVKMGADRSWVLAPLLGDAFAICEGALAPGNAVGADFPVVCSNPRGMRVVHEARLLQLRPGEAVIVMTKKGRRHPPLAGLVLEETRKPQGYHLERWVRSPGRSRR